MQMQAWQKCLSFKSWPAIGLPYAYYHIDPDVESTCLTGDGAFIKFIQACPRDQYPLPSIIMIDQYQRRGDLHDQ